MTNLLSAPEQFSTARLLIRMPKLDDAEAIFHAYAGDSDITYYMRWRAHATAKDTRGFLRLCLDQWSAGSDFTYAIAHPNRPDRPFGMISMHPRPRLMLFGYVLARKYWGQGYTTEALTCLVEWSLQQDEIWRASAFCDIDNLASARVMEKSGMSFEGILRRYCMHPNISDAPRDCRMYAKIK